MQKRKKTEYVVESEDMLIQNRRIEITIHNDISHSHSQGESGQSNIVANSNMDENLGNLELGSNDILAVKDMVFSY